MTDEIFIRSIFVKMDLFFFDKKIRNKIFIDDLETNTQIDNVLYLENEDNAVGVYVNGANPYFSPSLIYNFDAFNLYGSYNRIKITPEMGFDEFNVDRIKVILSTKYNELLGCYFSNIIDTKSLSLIFKQDELLCRNGLSFDDFYSLLESNLIHVSDKFIFTKNINCKDWLLVPK